MVKRAGQAPQLLTSQDDLASGDVVKTGLGSQAEILLNPGTYLRLAEESEFEMVDNSLDTLLVKLIKGSAIIEATGPGEVELRIPIITEQQKMTIVRAGIYRINVRPGVTELFVRKGRMALSGDRDNVIKSGKKITFSRAGQSVAKLEKTEKDQFDDWSKLRGQTLARANEKLSARTLNGYLASSTWGHLDSRFGRWAFGSGDHKLVVTPSCLSITAGAVRTAATMDSLLLTAMALVTILAQIRATTTRQSLLTRRRAMAHLPVGLPGRLRAERSQVQPEATAVRPAVLRRRRRVPDRRRVHAIPMGAAARSIE